MIVFGQIVAALVSAQAVGAPAGQLFGSLEGRWTCAGAFASGAPIKSDLQFTRSLDGAGLNLRQEDRPPGQFTMDASWSVDAQNGKLMSLAWTGMRGKPRRSAALYVADQFSEGGATLVQTSLLAPPWAPNRFRYAVNGRSLHIEWELQRNGEWRNGDSLDCRRAAASIPASRRH